MVKRFSLLIPGLLFVLLLLYGYNDFITSEQAGFEVGQNRTSVYYLLVSIIAVQILYIFFRFSGKLTFSGNIIPYLIVILCWVGLVNFYNERPFWISSVHLFLIVWWITSFLFSKIFVSRNTELLNNYLVFFILLYCLYFVFNLWARRNIISYTARDVAITGYSYYMVVFLPFFGILEKKWLRVILISSALIIIITSLKRGPIIIAPIMLLVRSFVKALNEGKGLSTPVRMTALLVLFIILFFWANSLTNGVLLDRFNQEELASGSGRSEMWKLAIEDIQHRDFTAMLLGKGSGSTIDLLETGAHNEWLEFLYCFGIIGVLLYALFCFKLISIMRRSIKRKERYAPELSMMIVFCLISGLFSGFFFQYSSFYYFSFLGIYKGLD